MANFFFKKRLCKKLDSIQGSFILTCYPFDGILDMLPKNVEIFKFTSIVYSSPKNIKPRKDELVIRRISSTPPTEDIQKLLNSGRYDCFTGNRYKAGPDGSIVDK